MSKSKIPIFYKYSSGAAIQFFEDRDYYININVKNISNTNIAKLNLCSTQNKIALQHISARKIKMAETSIKRPANKKSYLNIFFNSLNLNKISVSYTDIYPNRMKFSTLPMRFSTLPMRFSILPMVGIYDSINIKNDEKEKDEIIGIDCIKYMENHYHDEEIEFNPGEIHIAPYIGSNTNMFFSIDDNTKITSGLCIGICDDKDGKPTEFHTYFIILPSNYRDRLGEFNQLSNVEKLNRLLDEKDLDNIDKTILSNIIIDLEKDIKDPRYTNEELEECEEKLKECEEKLNGLRQKKPKPKPEPEQGWNCQACTFKNAQSMPRCEICNAEKPTIGGYQKKYRDNKIFYNKL